MKPRKFWILIVIVLMGMLFAGIQLVQADAILQVDTDSSDGCTGTWAFPELKVGGGDGVVFAQAAYEFDHDCQPVLVEEIYLNYVPAEVKDPESEPYQSITIPVDPPKAPYSPESIDSVDTCHVETWEEDAPGIDMISVLQDQTYSWNGSTVTLSNGSTTATMYLSWWHLNSGPSNSAGYNSPQVAYSNGQAGFYCDGGIFCGGGPNYYITLKAYMTVDYQGDCSGYGTYSGTVVPLGRLLYDVWK